MFFQPKLAGYYQSIVVPLSLETYITSSLIDEIMKYVETGKDCFCCDTDVGKRKKSSATMMLHLKWERWSKEDSTDILVTEYYGNIEVP